jgi:DNA-directed RNA polymerase specialized sigma24 family protein
MNKTKNLSDAALILACRQGDAVAWETLVLRYQRLIYTILRRSGLDKDTAAESFHRVFAQLLDELNTIKPSTVCEWLIVNACEEARRLCDAGTSEGDFAPLSRDILQRLIEQNAVYVAVMSLDARCRTTLSQVFYCNPPMAPAAVAAMVGVAEQDINLICDDCFRQLCMVLHKRML